MTFHHRLGYQLDVALYLERFQVRAVHEEVFIYLLHVAAYHHRLQTATVLQQRLAELLHTLRDGHAFQQLTAFKGSVANLLHALADVYLRQCGMPAKGFLHNRGHPIGHVLIFHLLGDGDSRGTRFGAFHLHDAVARHVIHHAVGCKVLYGFFLFGLLAFSSRAVYSLCLIVGKGVCAIGQACSECESRHRHDE